MTRFRRLFAILPVVLAIGMVWAPHVRGQALPGPSAAVNVPGGGTVRDASTEPASQGPAPEGAKGENYKLGTGDKMKINVYGEDDLSGEFAVDGSGNIQFPLIGQIKAAGLTADQFADALTRELGAKYLRDPRVSLQIENYRPFYIMGEVNRPGEYPYEDHLTVLGAIALAGGFTFRADDTEVSIRRNGQTKEDIVPANNATSVYPGDVVQVSERIF